MFDLAPPPRPAAPLPQSAEFARALAFLGVPAEIIAGPEGEGILVLPRRLGPLRLRLAVRPPPGSARTLARAGIRLIEADSTDDAPALRADGFRQIVTPAHLAEVDLAAGDRARTAGMHPKWRAALRAAERAGIIVRDQAFEGDPDHWLLAAEARQRRTRGYRALPLALTAAYARANPGAARLLTAHRGPGPAIAAMLFLCHGTHATYHHGWSGTEGRLFSAHHLILATAMDRLSAAGIDRLDLGPIETERNPGLARFKLGAGARIRSLGGSWLRLRP